MQRLAVTFRPLPATPPHFDPILEACIALRRATRVPFEVAHARAWRVRFARYSGFARRALVAHILRAERADSEVNGIAAERPFLLPLIARQAGEHTDLLCRSHQLVEDSLALSQPRLWDMVELAERAKVLERDVERHHDRLLTIVYEARLREFGGEGG